MGSHRQTSQKLYSKTAEVLREMEKQVHMIEEKC